MSVRSDIGPFAIIPEWLLYSGVSANAIRLFAILHRHDGAGGCHPARRRIASLMGCSEATVDRALRELMEAKAVTSEHRQTAEGDFDSNAYTLFLASPISRGVASPVMRGGLTSDATGGITSDEGVASPVTTKRKPFNESPFNEGRETAPRPLALALADERPASKARGKREAKIRPITDADLAALAADYPDFDVRAELENCRNLRYWETKYASEHAALRNRLRLKRADADSRKVLRAAQQPAASFSVDDPEFGGFERPVQTALAEGVS